MPKDMKDEELLKRVIECFVLGVAQWLNKKRLPHGKDSRLFNNITNFQILLFRLIGVVVGFVCLDKLLEYNGKLYTTVLSTSGSSLVGCHRLSLTVSFRLQAV